MTAPKVEKRIEISPGTHRSGAIAERFSGLLRRLSSLETRVLADDIATIDIESPVYVTGLARSGTTILLEMLSECSVTGTHKYRDFPFLEVPYYWNWFVDRAGQPVESAERAHKDGIIVSPESPEAMEEVLWMRFFPGAHDEAQSNVLDEHTRNDEFADFYRDHIRKLLYVRNRERYLCKGNYNVSRIRYLQKLFPDARFVIPVRDPVNHIASLAKQHALFSREETRDARILEHMRRSGHYEFGLNRTAINFGDSATVDAIRSLWDEQPVRGWARYWSSVYQYVLDVVGQDERLGEAVLVVRYEDLCRDPRNKLEEVFAHCGLPADDALLSKLSERPKMPSYYRVGFDDDEMAQIREETRETRERLGYAWQAVT